MEEQDSIEFIYQTVKEKVDLAFKDIERLEDKTNILNISGLVASLLLNVPENLPNIFQRAYFPLLNVSFIFFFFALLLNFMALRIKGYRRDPNPRALMEGYWDKPKKEVMRQLIANLVECYEHNATLISSATRLVNYSMILAFLGLVFLFASVLKN